MLRWVLALSCASVACSSGAVVGVDATLGDGPVIDASPRADRERSDTVDPRVDIAVATDGGSGLDVAPALDAVPFDVAIDAGQLAPLRHAPTEVVLFEDRVLRAGPLPDLVYRLEGPLAVTRDAGRMALSGAGAIVHPAQYRASTLFVRFTPRAGGLAVRVAHMGMTTVAGAPSDTPGYEVRFEGDRVEVVALATRARLARRPYALARDTATEVAVRWSVDDGALRVEMEGDRALEFAGLGLPFGGFALAGTSAGSASDVHAVRAVYQDTRPVLLYDGVDTMRDPTTGAVRATLPSIFTFPEQRYVTLSVDSISGYALLRYEGVDGQTHGYGVRALRTGTVELISDASGRCNGLHLAQGGSSFDGTALHANHDHQRMTWFSWYAYRNRLLHTLCFSDDHVGYGGNGALDPGGDFLNFVDPSMALDGSMARYVRLDNAWRGVTHVMAPPSIRAYVTWGDRALPGPSSAMTSHTGSGGPVGFAVRDADRLVYEEWSYPRFWDPAGGSNLHCGNFGFDLFTGRVDWAGPQRGWQRGLPTTTDYANTFPSMLWPGTMYGHLYEFDDAVSGGGRWRSMERVTFGEGRFVSVARTPTSSGLEVIYQP
ncbi:MAG: hypothetical protein R3A52_32095 [Polyangiales bacterium]